MSGCQGLEGENRRVTGAGYEVPLKGDENVTKSLVVMNIQLGYHTKNQ